MEFGIGARMRAARHLAGYREVGDLAAAMRGRGLNRGLGTTTLRKIEREERPADHRDLREIAETCGLPVEWFTADFERLPEISEDPRTVIARLTAEVARRAEERHAEDPEEPPAQSLEGAEP